jgi:hypothetical protein
VPPNKLEDGGGRDAETVARPGRIAGGLRAAGTALPAGLVEAAAAGRRDTCHAWPRRSRDDGGFAVARRIPHNPTWTRYT